MFEAICVTIAKRRSQILAGAGKALDEAFVTHTHEPRVKAEANFANLWVDLAGVRTRCTVFTLRLSFTGEAVHRAYTTSKLAMPVRSRSPDPHGRNTAIVRPYECLARCPRRSSLTRSGTSSGIQWSMPSMTSY